MLQVRNLGLSFSKQSKVFDNVNFHIKKYGYFNQWEQWYWEKFIINVYYQGNSYYYRWIITGDIIYKDVNITDMGIEAISGDAGYMFQDPDSQLCTFTVEDEIAFGLENIKIDPKKWMNLSIRHWI